MNIEIIPHGDASKRQTVDAHYGRTMAGVEFLFIGEYSPDMLDRWNAKKVGPPPVLFQKDMHSPAVWERTLRQCWEADVQDGLMAYRPPVGGPPRDMTGAVPPGPDIEMSLPKGRADRAVKP